MYIHQKFQESLFLTQCRRAHTQTHEWAWSTVDTSPLHPQQTINRSDCPKWLSSSNIQAPLSSSKKYAIERCKICTVQFPRRPFSGLHGLVHLHMDPVWSDSFGYWNSKRCVNPRAAFQQISGDTDQKECRPYLGSVSSSLRSCHLAPHARWWSFRLSLHSDFHSTTKTKDQRQSRFLLDILIRTAVKRRECGILGSRARARAWQT